MAYPKPPDPSVIARETEQFKRLETVLLKLATADVQMGRIKLIDIDESVRIVLVDVVRQVEDCQSLVRDALKVVGTTNASETP
jgi:hypothetical protein